MAETHELTLNQVRLGWDLEAGSMSFFGIPAVVFWLNPSLYRMLKPLVEVCGVDRFRLLVAHESSKGTAEDYHAMVTQLGDSFAEGFLAWGAAVATASWGRIELPEFDLDERHARVRITNPWELKMVADTGDCWGCPFMQGKIIGVFSHAFGVSCWADEEELVVTRDEQSVEFRVYPADRTIATELARVEEAQRSERERGMQEAVASATQELQEKLELVAEQRSVIRRLSTPLIQVWDGVLVLPLIGVLDEQRADVITQSTLETVATRGTRHLILDLTGVSDFGARAADHLLRTVSAVSLLGARCMLTGVSPGVARALVDVGTQLQGVPSYATVQAALEHVLTGATRA